MENPCCLLAVSETPPPAAPQSRALELTLSGQTALHVETAGELVSCVEQSNAQIISIVLHGHFTETCLFNCMITNLSSCF